MRYAHTLFALCVRLLRLPTHAETPAEMAATYAQAAGGKASAEAGKALYFREVQKNGKAISCATCHTKDPKAMGMTLAFREINPLAPIANPRRLTDPKKVDKWFRRNCDDVFSRECTPQEKADYLAWLLSVR